VPDPVDIRLRVARGRRLVISLDETVTVPAATAAARALRVALQPDLIVIASPSRAGRGPTLTMLQLVTDSEAATVRPAQKNLVAPKSDRWPARSSIKWGLVRHLSLASTGTAPRLSNVATRPGTWTRTGSTAGSKIR
jgi:hypothetical protein